MWGAKNPISSLPFVWTGGTSSDLLKLDGTLADDLGSDYAASHNPYRIKFDTTGDYIQIRTDSQPGQVTIGVKMIGGNNTSYIAVKGSADGVSYTTIESLEITGSTNSIHTLSTSNNFASTDRYIRLEFTKGSNVGVGPITVSVIAPTFSVAAGNFYSAFNLDITAVEGATLKYTIDGSNPSSSGTATSVDNNTTTVSIPASTTRVRAIAIKSEISSFEADATYTYIDASSPHADVSETALAFGDVEVAQTKQMTFTVTPANLTGDLTLSSDNAKYTVSPTSIAQATTTAQTITVTAAPTALNDDMDGEITISGGGITSQTVSLSATPYQVANVTLIATDNKGTFKQGDNVVTSITSRVGSSATVTAVPVAGYLFDSWSATGATPASSTTATTEFTFTSTTPTLTANFVVDNRLFTTLDDKTIPAPDANGSYSDPAWTIVNDGLIWKLKTYKAKDLKTLQIRAKTAGGESYIKLPTFSGDIQSITCSVTSGSGTEKDGASSTTALFFQTGNTNAANEVVATSNTDNSNSRIIDISSIQTKYNTGYITANGSIRIWDITVAYIPTDINVSVTSAKYATFSDHIARDFSTSGITVLKAVPDGAGKVDLEEISDGIVPANEGVVLYSDDEVNAAIPATKATGTGDFSGNEMVANVVKTWITEDGGSSKVNYILSNGTNGVGFYKAKAAGANLAAHRAYLSTAATAGAREYLEFAFGETTDITKIENTKQGVEGYYNLNGQRVAQPQKGLYIVNGKKVVIK